MSTLDRCLREIEKAFLEKVLQEKKKRKNRVAGREKRIIEDKVVSS